MSVIRELVSGTETSAYRRVSFASWFKKGYTSPWWGGHGRTVKWGGNIASSRRQRAGEVVTSIKTQGPVSMNQFLIWGFNPQPHGYLWARIIHCVITSCKRNICMLLQFACMGWKCLDLMYNPRKFLNQRSPVGHLHPKFL